MSARTVAYLRVSGKQQTVENQRPALEALTRELGAAKAGPPSYVGWYLNWLVKHGHRPPTSK